MKCQTIHLIRTAHAYLHVDTMSELAVYECEYLLDNVGVGFLPSGCNRDFVNYD